jgi:transposase-like protein
LYGTEELCRAALFAWRWPEGFVCPRCGDTHYSPIRTRGLLQCRACRRQVSLTAGTIFHASNLPLGVWFQAIYLLTQSKKGISCLELSHRLGVSCNTAWKMQHKLMQVMLEREAGQPLGGGGRRVEIDDAYLGGSRSGGKRGRGAPGKTPFVAAVETADKGEAQRPTSGQVAGFQTGQHYARQRGLSGISCAAERVD